MNIVLVGYRCSGKTQVGKRLARELGYAFQDTDSLIEARTKLSIKKIIETKGESWFREIESDILREVLKSDGSVISTGGGVVLKYKNVHNIKRRGRVVFLKASVEEIQKRMGRDKNYRPQLTDMPMSQEIREQMLQRESYYIKASDLVVDTDGKSIEEVVEEIIEKIKAMD